MASGRCRMRRRLLGSAEVSLQGGAAERGASSSVAWGCWEVAGSLQRKQVKSLSFISKTFNSIIIKYLIMKILLYTFLVYLFFSCSLAAQAALTHDGILPEQAHQHDSTEAGGRIDKVVAMIKKLEAIMSKVHKDTNHLYDLDKAQGKELDDLEHHIKKMCEKLVDEMLEHIRNRGLNLGKRWKIAQEMGEHLVLRDMVSTERGSDSRYLLSKGVKHDV